MGARVSVSFEQRFEVIRRIVENEPYGYSQMISMMERIARGVFCHIVTLPNGEYIEVHGATSVEGAKKMAKKKGFEPVEVVFEADWPYEKGHRRVDTVDWRS